MSAAAARLARLVVRDFRNLEHVDLAPPAAGWVVVGENGQGKTNLLEAIHYLQLLRSSRGARDADVVRFGADGFHVAAQVDTGGACHEISVGFERAGHRKRARVDGAVPERLSDALGALPSVMFAPDDVSLVTGSPAERRRFLDVVLAVTDHSYLVALQQYRAALLRRNAALRSAAVSGGADAVAVWEPALAQYGAALWRERRAWVVSMEDRLETLCREIGEGARVRMRYASTLAAADDPRAALARALAEKRAVRPAARPHARRPAPRRPRRHARRARLARVRIGRAAAHGGDRAADARGGHGDGAPRARADVSPRRPVRRARRAAVGADPVVCWSARAWVAAWGKRCSRCRATATFRGS